jgi:hypothetical protein
LMIEAWRGDSLLLPGGIRAAQVAGLMLIIAALLGARRHAMTHTRSLLTHEPLATTQAAPLNDS